MKTLLLALPFTALLTSAAAADFSSFSTAGHPKAQGVSISFAYPAGWVAKDHASPGVVHEFRDPARDGRDALIILVPTSQPVAPTADDFRKSFQVEDAQEKILPGARHRKKEFVEGLAFPCVALDYDLPLPELAPDIAQVRNYILLVEDKMVQIHFYSVAPASDDIRSAREGMMNHVIRSIEKAQPTVK